MNRDLCRWVLLSVTLVASAYAGTASGHTQFGVLGKAPDTTDIYQVTCSDDGNGPPDRLILQILGTGPKSPAHATVRGEKDSIVVTTTDTITGDKHPSPEVGLYLGPDHGEGIYNVTVYKTSKPGKPPKARAYRLVYD